MSLDAGHIDRVTDASPVGCAAPVPHLMAPKTRLSHATSGVTKASLCLPESLVHERATALAERACAAGAAHSLRIWRVAHREALLQLAREASAVAAGTGCEALFWERDSALYYVTATFCAAHPTLH
jgi:hypothetical protein